MGEVQREIDDAAGVRLLLGRVWADRPVTRHTNLCYN